MPSLPLVFLFSTLLGAAFLNGDNTLPGAKEVANVLSQLSAITGMPVRHPLQFQSISRPDVSRYLEKRAHATVSAKSIDAEETALKLLHLVPASFNLRKTTLALMTEQAAAFYDYHRRALFLADWTPATMRDTAVAHELAHALADQTYHLEKFQRQVRDDSERSAAREAVIEGQASYLMNAYAAKMIGNPPLEVSAEADAFEKALEPSPGAQYPIFDHAPLYIRAGLIFPYTTGTAFQAAVVKRFGQQAFRRVFEAPPISTHQIFHPESYLANEPQHELSPPDTPLGTRVFLQGALGELDHRILIEMFASREIAKQLSPHFRAGYFQVLEDRKTHEKALAYGSVWTDETSAISFQQIYSSVIPLTRVGTRITSTALPER